MNIFYTKDTFEDEIVLKDEEFRHCIKSLRKRTGDQIRVTNGRGSLYNCQILEIGKSECSLTVLDQITQQKSGSELSIAIAPTKNMSRFEWFLEKSVEIGVKSIYPIITKNSERTRIRKERLDKIVLSAMKQSSQYWLPELKPLINITAFLTLDHSIDNRWIAHLNNDAKAFQEVVKSAPTTIIIGPEGDFTKEEVDLANQAGFMNVSLGKTRLRTETAGVVATTLFNIN